MAIIPKIQCRNGIRTASSDKCVVESGHGTTICPHPGAANGVHADEAWVGLTNKGGFCYKRGFPVGGQRCSGTQIDAVDRRWFQAVTYYLRITCDGSVPERPAGIREIPTTQPFFPSRTRENVTCRDLDQY